jgi:hypothetical protein
MQWGKWDERWLTHPSTLRRVQAIAQRNGISSERLQEILDAPDADAERYALPPALVSEEKIFSTAFKASVQGRVSWTTTLVMVMTPALVVRAAQVVGWEGWSVALVGFVVTFALYLMVVNFVSVWNFNSLLRQRLREKLEREGIATQDGIFIGFAPAPSPRLYEAFYDWDVGFLFITSHHLCYVGEQTRFALRREQVMDVRLGEGAPHWLPAPRVYVTWRDDERGAEGTFNVRPADVRSLWQHNRASSVLTQQLKAWQASSSETAALPSVFADLMTPHVSEVTSLSPRALFKVPTFVFSTLLHVTMSYGVCVLLGLPLAPQNGGAGLFAVLTTTLITVLQWRPRWRYREPT